MVGSKHIINYYWLLKIVVGKTFFAFWPPIFATYRTILHFDHKIEFLHFFILFILLNFTSKKKCASTYINTSLTF
jgi:hypothetical protein